MLLTKTGAKENINKQSHGFFVESSILFDPRASKQPDAERAYIGARMDVKNIELICLQLGWRLKRTSRGRMLPEVLALASMVKQK
jgi:hypothetical protein